MQRIMGLARKAITEYNMIQDGDRVAVGVSGGKDSVALTLALQRLRRFIGIDYQVAAITLDPCFGGVECDYSPIAELLSLIHISMCLRDSYGVSLDYLTGRTPTP